MSLDAHIIDTILTNASITALLGSKGSLYAVGMLDSPDAAGVPAISFSVNGIEITYKNEAGSQVDTGHRQASLNFAIEGKADEYETVYSIKELLLTQFTTYSNSFFDFNTDEAVHVRSCRSTQTEPDNANPLRGREETNKFIFMSFSIGYFDTGRIS